jgi:hypothetical protein
MISKFHEFIMTIYLSTGRPKKFGMALQMNHDHGPSSNPKNQIGEHVYRENANGREGSAGYVNDYKGGKKWVISYFDNTKQNVDEETLIQLRKAYENRIWEKRSTRITISPTKSANLPGYLVGSKVRRKFDGYNRDYMGDVNKYDTATKLYLIVYDDEEEHYVTVREVLKILYVPPKNMTTDGENVSEDEWDNENNINDNSHNNDSRNKKSGSNSGRDNNIRGDNDNIFNDNSRNNDSRNKKVGGNSSRDNNIRGDNDNIFNDNNRNNDSRNKKVGGNSGRDINIRGDNDNIINDNNRNSDSRNKKGGNNSGRNNNDNKSNNELLNVKKGGKFSKSSHDIDESDNDNDSMISKNKNKKQKLSPQDQAVRDLLELSKEFESNQINRERELKEEKIMDDKECEQKKIKMKLYKESR